MLRFFEKRFLIDVKANYFLLTNMQGVETEWLRLSDVASGTEKIFSGLIASLSPPPSPALPLFRGNQAKNI